MEQDLHQYLEPVARRVLGVKDVTEDFRVQENYSADKVSFILVEPCRQS